MSKPDGQPLISLVEADRGKEAADYLAELRSKVIPEQTQINLRDMRNKIAVHLDSQLSLEEIVETLESVDVDELLRFTDAVLDHLDTAACAHVDLGLLVLGHREVSSLEPTVSQGRPPYEHESTARFLDSPYAVFVDGAFAAKGSGAIAGVTAGRVKRRRSRWFDGEAEALAA